MKNALLLLASFLMVSCYTNEKNTTIALKSIQEKDIAKHVKILASDAFMGRKPFTEGGIKTTQYLKDEFTKIGLESSFQEVPLVQVTGNPSLYFQIQRKNKKLSLALNTEYVAFSKVQKEQISIDNAPLVFAGYGIVAPEYNWNDYKDIDVLQKLLTNRGKIFSRKRSGNCAGCQRKVKTAVKRARFMALLPYTS